MLVRIMHVISVQMYSLIFITIPQFFIHSVDGHLGGFVITSIIMLCTFSHISLCTCAYISVCDKFIALIALILQPSLHLYLCPYNFVLIVLSF